MSFWLGVAVFFGIILLLTWVGAGVVRYNRKMEKRARDRFY